MRRPPDATLARFAAFAITAIYAVLGLVVFAPEGLYSGDVGVKYVQARALAASGFRSLDVPYPGAFLDPAREFFPLRPPFVMPVGNETQTIFSPASAVLEAGPTALADIRGMTAVSLLAALAILLGTAAFAPEGLKSAAVFAVGAASPLWAYAVLGLDHAPAIAFSTVAFAIALRSQHPWRTVFAGLLLGVAALLRDEVLLLAPGLLLITVLRDRSWRAAMVLPIAVVAVLAAGAAADVFWFGRPAMAHLRHAVDLSTAESAPELADSGLPTLEDLTLRERFDVVIHYWLVGYGKDGWLAAFVAALGLALLVRWRVPTPAGSSGLLVWVLAILALAAYEAWDLVHAPKFLAGFHRVAPYLVFALLPPPSTRRETHWLPLAVLAMTAVFVGIAFATTNTTGGKSLGPRLLLPLLPLVAVTALWRMAAYLRAPARIERGIGMAGVALVCLTVVFHAAGTIPAYYGRNSDDSSTVLTADAAAARVVIADDPFTAQLLFPLFYRKIIFLADSHARRAELAARLAEAKVPDVLLISRRFEPATTLSPLRIQSSDKIGRMYIQYWGRVGRELK